MKRIVLLVLAMRLRAARGRPALQVRRQGRQDRLLRPAARQRRGHSSLNTGIPRPGRGGQVAVERDKELEKGRDRGARQGQEGRDGGWQRQGGRAEVHPGPGQLQDLRGRRQALQVHQGRRARAPLRRGDRGQAQVEQGGHGRGMQEVVTVRAALRAAAAALAVAASGPAVPAITLGDVEVRSALGEALDARIPVTAAPGDTLRGACFSVAPDASGALPALPGATLELRPLRRRCAPARADEAPVQRPRRGARHRDRLPRNRRGHRAQGVFDPARSAASLPPRR